MNDNSAQLTWLMQVVGADLDGWFQRHPAEFAVLTAFWRSRLAAFERCGLWG